MRHSGSIAGVEIGSDHDFVVFGPNMGVIAECADLAEGKRVLRQKLAESKECNVLSDLAIYRWSDGKWTAAINLYEMQQWEIERNPTQSIHFP